MDNSAWSSQASGVANSITGGPIDSLDLTSWRPCWRHNTKEYVISSIVGSCRRGWLTLCATSREIDCKPRIFIKYKTIDTPKIRVHRSSKKLISKEINCAEQDYMNMCHSPLSYRICYATVASCIKFTQLIRNDKIFI